MIKNKLKYCLLLTIFICFASSTKATHIVGGELYYNHISGNNYEVVFEYYIDCINGYAPAIAEDSIAWFAVYDGKTNERISSLDRMANRAAPVRVTDVNYNCIITKPNACVDKYQYRFTLNLPPREGGYIIVHQRCCRNGTITNLTEPWLQGSTYFTKIEDTEIRRNDAAKFKNFPPNFLCINAPLVFDHSATDADGDSLVYELYQPFNSFIGNIGAQLQTNTAGPGPKPRPKDFLPPPFKPVTWANGYDTDLQINATKTTIINRSTGMLNFIPTQVGQFVVGISVKEYRDGQLINITRRDFQFNVSNCVFEVVALFDAKDKNCDPKVAFNNYSKGAGTLQYSWDFGDINDSNSKSTMAIPEHRYKNPGNFNVALIANNGNCADTYSRPVTILQLRKPDLGPDDTIRCENLLPVLDAGPGLSYLWQDGSTESKFNTQKPGSYIVSVEDQNGCFSSDTIIISKGENVFSANQYMPNAFTPNNDGVNDLFPQNQFTDTSADYQLQIFTRWGEKVAEYNSPLYGWDGRYQGIMQEEGVYIYLINWMGCDGVRKYKRGNITLLK